QEFELPSSAKIKSLSKGMRAKVALSLAMAFDPAVLILDEPTSGLDPLVRRTFLESMIERAASGQTVFLSSHQINEVERVADWVAILHQGVLQVAAPLEDLKNDVTMLSFSKQDPLLTDPVELDNCKVLQRSEEGRSVRMMVIGSVDGTVEKLQAHSGILDVKAMRPNLEELYLGFTQPADVDVEEKPLIKLPGQSVA
ncbi:MAG: AAA family ATPase, partial [Planctomycetota bacterium]